MSSSSMMSCGMPYSQALLSASCIPCQTTARSLLHSYRRLCSGLVQEWHSPQVHRSSSNVSWFRCKCRLSPQQSTAHCCPLLAAHPTAASCVCSASTATTIRFLDCRKLSKRSNTLWKFPESCSTMLQHLRRVSDMLPCPPLRPLARQFPHTSNNRSQLVPMPDLVRRRTATKLNSSMMLSGKMQVQAPKWSELGHIRIHWHMDA